MTDRSSQDEFPTYAELQNRPGAARGTAWGIFGDDDEIGTLNHLTPERVLAALACAKTGEVVNLDLPLEAFDPPVIGTRRALQHTIFANNPHHRDDHVDQLYLQSGSQLDGLRHIGHPDHGFYNGVDPALFEAGEPTLGINRYAEHGIVGRGVLLDVDRYRRSVGRPVDHDGAEAIPVADVEATAQHQGVDLVAGDILMIRTGWAYHYLHELDDEGRAASRSPLRASGLLANEETAAWLWDNRFAVVATDNFALEAWPAPADSPFVSRAEEAGEVARSSHTGLLHRVLIPLLGMALGELWDLDALADRCAQDERWDCLVIAKPLNLTGGAGSPANALAIR